MPTYTLQSFAGSGGYLNVAGNHQVSQNRNVNIYQSTGSDDQKWVISSLSGATTRVLSAISTAYGLNVYRSGSPWNCDIHTVSDNATDSAIIVKKSGSYYKLQLANYPTMYLTAAGTSNNSNVYWAASTSGNSQLWKIEIVNTPSSDGYTGNIYTDKVGTVVADVTSYGYQYPPNPFHGDKTGYYGQCTWYAWGRAYERCGISLSVTGNAGLWYNNIQTNSKVTKVSANAGPVAKSIAVFQLSGEAGHVVFVEQVDGNYVYFTEGNTWCDDGQVQRKTKTEFNTLWGKKIAGYIKLS